MTEGADRVDEIGAVIASPESVSSRSSSNPGSRGGSACRQVAWVPLEVTSTGSPPPGSPARQDPIEPFDSQFVVSVAIPSESTPGSLNGSPTNRVGSAPPRLPQSTSTVNGGDWSVSSFGDVPRLAGTLVDGAATPPQGSLAMPKRLQLLGGGLSPLPSQNPRNPLTVVPDDPGSQSGSLNGRPALRPDSAPAVADAPQPTTRRWSGKGVLPWLSVLVAAAVLLALCLLATNVPHLAATSYTVAILDDAQCGEVGQSAPVSLRSGQSLTSVLRPAVESVFHSTLRVLEDTAHALVHCQRDRCIEQLSHMTAGRLASTLAAPNSSVYVLCCVNGSRCSQEGNVTLDILLGSPVDEGCGKAEILCAGTPTLQSGSTTQHCVLRLTARLDPICGSPLSPASTSADTRSFVQAVVPVDDWFQATDAAALRWSNWSAWLQWVAVNGSSPATLALHLPVSSEDVTYSRFSDLTRDTWRLIDLGGAALTIDIIADRLAANNHMHTFDGVWAPAVPVAQSEVQNFTLSARAMLTFFLVVVGVLYAAGASVVVRHYQEHVMQALAHVVTFADVALDWRADFNTDSSDPGATSSLPWIWWLLPKEVSRLKTSLTSAQGKLLEYKSYLPSSMLASTDAYFLTSDDAEANVSEYAPLFRLFPEVEDDHPPMLQVSIRGGASSTSLSRLGMGASRGQRTNSPGSSTNTPPGSPSSRMRHRADEVPIETNLGRDTPNRNSPSAFRAFRSPTSPQLDVEGGGGDPFSNSVAGSFSLSPTARSSRRVHAGGAAARMMSVVSLSPARTPADVTTFTLGKKRITCLVARLYFPTAIHELPTRLVQQVADAFQDVASQSARQFDGVLHKAELTSVTILWNAFAPYPFHELRASLCAQFVAGQLHRREEEVPAFKRCRVRYSIAVNTGGAVVGTCGTARHSAFCAVSDSWTFAEKVCDLGQMLDCGVLLLEPTHAIARNQLFCVPIDIVGSDQMRVTLFELRGDSGSKVFGKFKTYLEAFSLFAQCQFSQAAPLLEACDSNPHAVRLLRFCRLYAAENDAVTRYWRSAPFWTVHEFDAQDLATNDYVAKTLGGSEQLTLSGSFSMGSPNAKALPQPGSTKFGVHAQVPQNSGERSHTFQVIMPPALALPAYGVRRRARHHSLRPELALRTELESRASEDRQRHSQSASVLGTPQVVSPGVFGEDSHTAFPADHEAELEALTQESGITDTVGRRWTVSEKVLGEGAFGTVRLGLSDNGQLVALKYLTLPQDLLEGSGTFRGGGSLRLMDGSRFKNQVESTLAEVALLSKLHHDNIVSYLGSALSADALIVIMEYVSGGTLGRLLSTFGWLPVAAIRLYARDVLQGLRYLHGKSIVHRDISPQNILVTPEGRCKLTDFGASIALQKLAGGQRGVFGTPAYMAPEACRGQPVVASDIWSLGILLCQLFCGEIPFKEDLDRANIEGFMKALGHDESMVPQIPSRRITDEAALDMIRSCLLRDPQLRPTADQLLLHPFFI